MNNDGNMTCGVAAQAGSLADRSLSMMARIAVTALLALAGVAMFPTGEAWAQARPTLTNISVRVVRSDDTGAIEQTLVSMPGDVNGFVAATLNYEVDLSEADIAARGGDSGGTAARLSFGPTAVGITFYLLVCHGNARLSGNTGTSVITLNVDSVPAIAVARTLPASGESTIIDMYITAASRTPGTVDLRSSNSNACTDIEADFVAAAQTVTNKYTVTINRASLDPTSVTVTPAETSVVEGDSAFDITVALNTAVRTGTVTLPYVFSGAGITTDDFSYTDGTDTTGLTGNLVFAATEQSKVIAVTALADSTTETDGETLKFKLTAGTHNGVVVQATDEVDITINDAPPSSVTVTPTIGTIPETGGSVVITVALDNPLRASDSPSGTTVDIPYTLTGTATVTDDYTVQCGDDAASLGTCTSPFAFAAGDQSKIVRVTAVSDFADDDDETVILALADADIMLPDSSTLNVPDGAGAVITITDDDVPPTAVSSITPNPATIREDGGASTITVTLDSAAVTGGVSIPYAFSGTADRGTDFNAPAGPLVIPAGSSSGTIAVTVPSTAADDDDEDDETIILTLMSTTPVLTLPSPATATITITDLANAITLRWRDNESEVPLGTTNPLDLSSATADFARRSNDDGEGPFYLELPDNVAAGDVIEVQYEVRSADGSTSELTLFITVPASSTP